MTTCADAVHNLYPDNCPTCNPAGYRALIAEAPVGQEHEPTMEGARAQQAWREQQGQQEQSVQEGYSDTY